MARNWNFAVPRVEGVAPRQAGVAVPKELWERELSREGFSGAAVEFYHRNPPTAFSDIDQELRPHLFDVDRLTDPVESPWQAAVLLHNADTRIRFWRTQQPMNHLVRNADGDDLLFVHRGGGDIYCDFGHIELREGDYFVIPRGCSWRLEPAQATQMLMIEATGGSFSRPDNAANLGRYAPFDPGVFGVPSIDEAFKSQQRDKPWAIHVKRGGKVGCITYPYNPLDAEAWKGDLYPIRLNVADIRPVMSHRIHLAPSANSTFVSDRFVVCTFVPKPGETDPEAGKLPPFHDNVDFDEVMFLHEGSKTPHRVTAFKEGMLTFHPAGVTHGPHPGAFAVKDATEPIPLESTFVMIDTRNPLSVHEDAAAADIAGYEKSWTASIGYAPDARKGR
ncbi:MAG TPA: homogentisate 1,2-dioxygenase [Burkholderiaceae bacterium]|nr:homogentisate 1,2-dioxygenase [Burkholderiaceae bacterium]